MVKRFLCAVTHVRHENYFLQKWIEYYSGIVGRENLYVVIDGDDWTPEVDLTGIHVEVKTDGPRRRLRNDRWAAKVMSGKANFLRKSYEYVIRGDVDEYVVIDPKSGLNWENAFEELGDEGYIFALGVDMVQAPDEGSQLDNTQPVLSQRKHGFVSDKYTKPFVISRWSNWSGGAHRLLNRTVKISNHFVLFHMALCDKSIAAQRLEARGGQTQHRSFALYQTERLMEISDDTDSHIFDYDEAAKIAFGDFPYEADGTLSKRPRASKHPLAQDKGLYTVVPDRFFDLV